MFFESNLQEHSGIYEDAEIAFGNIYASFVQQSGSSAFKAAAGEIFMLKINIFLCLYQSFRPPF